MWKLLPIFIVTAVIVHFLFREKDGKDHSIWHKKKRIPKVLKKIKSRGVIIEPTEYTQDYSLAYYDGEEKDSDFHYLQEQGYQGGGFSWSGIVYGLLQIKDPDLLSRIEIDPEGNGLLINADNRKDIEKVSFLIDSVKSDKKLMQRAILRANMDGKME